MYNVLLIKELIMIVTNDYGVAKKSQYRVIERPNMKQNADYAVHDAYLVGQYGNDS